MKNKHLFSIIITAYNVENYISTALESVVKQTECDYEIIIVNDGSTDDTGNIINAFMKSNTDKDVKKVEFQTCKGAARGRNAGVKEAEGAYICFLDADDYWYSNKLETVKQEIRKKPDVSIFWHWEDHVNEQYKTVTKRKYRAVNSEHAYLDLLYNGNCLSTSAVVVKKENLNRVYGFNEAIICGEDYDLWLRLAKAGGRFCLIRKFLGIYLVRGSGLTSDYVRYYTCIIGMLQKHFMYLERHSLHPERVRRGWKKIKAGYLCSMARKASVCGDKQRAFQTYRESVSCDPFCLKSYAGIMLLFLGL